ncbi:hypothetical protein [Gordonia neofelifaecis]|nr:hypothetical protein [Gordonia neofelifaecis]EGD53210.1 hypothetical protein SCNU_20022 [Gordonia neofelifaecis NRRL B-59395]
MVNPKPTVTIAVRQPGVTTSTTLTPTCSTALDADGRECLPAADACILGDLTIDWGRSDVWTQPDPAVATAVVWQSDRAAELNPSVNLARATPGRGLVGLDFDVVVPRTAPATGSFVVFRGRTTNVDAERSQQRTVNGLENGWMLRIQAADRSASLAQVDKQGFVKLDADRTMKANADFLNTLSSWAGIRETYFEAAYQNGKCRFVDMTDKTLLEVIVELYASFSHQFVYNPRRNVIIRIPAAYDHGSYSLQFGRRNVGDTVRLYAPAWVDNTGREDPQDSEPYPSGYVGGDDVSGDVRISSDQVNAITHLECKWYDSVAAKKDIISRVVVDDSANRGLLRFDSWFEDGLQIDPIMQDVKRKCLAEGARAFHPTIVYDTRRAGDIPDWNTLETLACPAQTVRMVVVAGSPFAALMDVPPVWYPAGGVIAYGGGHWTFTTHLAPAPITLAGSPVTFANLASSSTGSTLTLGQLDKSISSYDLRFCSDPALYIWS